MPKSAVRTRRGNCVQLCCFQRAAPCFSGLMWAPSFSDFKYSNGLLRNAPEDAADSMISRSLATASDRHRGIDGDHVLFLSRTGRLTFMRIVRELFQNRNTSVGKFLLRPCSRHIVYGNSSWQFTKRKKKKRGLWTSGWLGAAVRWITRALKKTTALTYWVKRKDFVQHMFIPVYRVFIFRSRTDQNKRGGQTRVQRTLRHSHIET